MSHGSAPAQTGLIASLERTSFFGRDAEIAAVLGALEGGHRLISVCGPPGIGKSRVARRVLGQLGQRFGRSLFVSVSDASERAAFIAAVGSKAGAALAAVADEGANAVGEALVRLSPCVLVLDSAERAGQHLDLIEQWLARAPDLAVVCTTRSRLRAPGERVIEVAPLSVPQAVALFEERARLRTGRPLDEAEIARVGDIVLRLDCIPLAIEIAAARAALLGVCAIQQKLDGGFGILVDGAPVDVRHRSVHAAVSWSWELLNQHERTALAQLCVFHEVFTLEAAEAVLDVPEPGVADMVQRLREHSLLWAQRDELGALRFGVFRIVRDFIQGQAGIAAGASERHARFFAAHGLRRSGQALVIDAPDLELAFDRTADDATQAQLALVLSQIFLRRGVPERHRAILARGIAAAVRVGDQALEHDLLQARAMFASHAGEIGVARTAQERALELARSLGDAAREAFALARLGWDKHELADVQGGMADMRAAVALAVEHRDVEREAYARNRVGHALVDAGALAAGAEELSRAASLAAQSTNRWLRQKTLVEVASVQRRRGAADAAAQALLELAALGEPADASIAAAVRLEHASLARGQGRFVDAERLGDQALALADVSGAPRARALARIERAWTSLDTEDAPAALRLLDDALAFAAPVENPALRARALCVLAHARYAAHDLEGARAACTLAESLGATEANVEVHLGVLSAVLEHALGKSDGLPRLRTAVDVARNAGGKLLLLAHTVQALLEPGQALLHRASNDGLLVRFGDAEARAIVDVASGAATSSFAIARALIAVRGVQSRREMLVGPECRFYELDGRRVSLQRQRSLRLILLALIEHAERRPGVGLSQRDVLAQGWPGERMRSDSGATRVYTSIRRLRRAGLEGVLITRDDGYLIDPTVALRRGA